MSAQRRRRGLPGRLGVRVWAMCFGASLVAATLAALAAALNLLARSTASLATDEAAVGAAEIKAAAVASTLACLWLV